MNRKIQIGSTEFYNLVSEKILSVYYTLLKSYLWLLTFPTKSFKEILINVSVEESMQNFVFKEAELALSEIISEEI